MSNQKVNIFIADDDRFYLSCMVEFLKNNFSCDITTFDNEIALFRANSKPDILFTDIEFGYGKSSSTLSIEKVKKYFPETKVVFLSVITKSREELNALCITPTDFVVKISNDYEAFSSVINSVSFQKRLVSNTEISNQTLSNNNKSKNMKTLSRLSFLSWILTAFIMICSFNSFSQTASQYSVNTVNSASITTDLNGNTIPSLTASIGSSQLNTRNGYNAIAMGFTFPFLGSNFTYISFNTNGMARLATSNSSNTIAGDNNNLNDNTFNISPFCLKMKTSSSGSVKYARSGTAPFRCFVIQWSNMCINSNSSTANGTFQLRLYEKTGVIEFTYGTMGVGSINANNSDITFSTGFSDGGSNDLSLTNSSNNNFSTSSSISSLSIATFGNANVTNLSNKTYCLIPPQVALNVSSLGLTSSSNLNFSNANVIIDQNTTVNNIYVNENANLTLASGVTLVANGDIICSTNGYITGNKNASITLNGSGTGTNLRFDQTTTGTTNTLLNFTLNRTGGNATVSNRLEFDSKGGTLTLNAGQLIINDTLVFNSSSSGTAMVDVIPNANLGTNLGGTNPSATYDPVVFGTNGCVKFCTYIGPSGRRWRFIASSIKNSTFEDLRKDIFITGAGTGTTVGQLNSHGFDATATNSPTVYSFNETNYSWVALTNSSSSLSSQNIVNGKGYRIFIRGDRSDVGRLTGTNNSQNAVVIDLNGDFIRGSVNIPVTYTAAAGSPGWNLISNPYPSAFNWNAFYNAGHSGNNGTNYTNIDPTIYIFNAKTNSYISYNAISNISGDNSFANGIIPPGATFFLKTTGANPTLIFKEQFKYTTDKGADCF